MTRAVAWVAGAVGTVAALTVLPWAQYGDIGVRLTRFPHWGLHAAALIALSLLTLWVVAGGNGTRRPLRYAGVALSVASVGTAIEVIWRYDEASVLFGPIVPMVIPSPGLGGPVAIAAALINAATLAVGRRSSDATPHPSEFPRSSR